MSGARSKGEVSSAISDGLVALHTRYYGKGPERVKTHIADDLVLTVLWGGFTQVERTLIDTGRGATVAELRRAFQDSMRAQFVAVAEEATGRTVVSYMSQVDVTSELCVELFVFAPEP